jgi:hypothetical protein
MERCTGHEPKVDITIKPLISQEPGHMKLFFSCCFRIPDNTGGKEKAFDRIFPVKIPGNFHNLFRGQGNPAHIPVTAIRTIGTFSGTVVGQ